MQSWVPIWVLRDLVTPADFAGNRGRTKKQHGAAPLLVLIGVVAPETACEAAEGAADGAAHGDKPAVTDEERHCGGGVVEEEVRVLLVYEISN